MKIKIGDALDGETGYEGGMKAKELARECDRILETKKFRDFPGAKNGLQVNHGREVKKIDWSVDADLESILKAGKEKVDFLIVHHGIFWGGVQPVTGPVYERYAALIRGNCAVYSSHLPLDAHEEIGNNVLLARQLGLKARRPFLFQEGEPIGWIAANKLKRSQLCARLEELYPRVVTINCGPAVPKQVGFCSGSGNSAVPQLIAAGVDTLITGELREEWFNYAQENHLNLICCGHYATEMHGVKALAAELAKKFRLPWEFIETDNPL